ncbi:hypothetical protein OESDEN_20890 [Oesophagostomum dentatum]|uniref:Tc1-like transposase DDE domain-containing protein n=1 Tax=Oesophagostomum dentatum TaxID=61180 RepID=A0A0B1S3G3_OESDE|nr:hypothetical protein OESDEN_20890 [Oesophagostomum dentatum]
MSGSSRFAIENAVISRHIEGLPMTEILRDLLPCFPSMTYEKVRTIVRKFKAFNLQGHPKEKPKFPSRKFNQYEIFRIQNVVTNCLEENNEITTKELCARVATELSFDVKPTMMTRLVQTLGFDSKSVRTGQLIHKTNREKRLAFCKEMISKKVRMDSKLYCKILRDYYIPFAYTLYNNKCRLAQDNDPKHVSRFTVAHLDKWQIKRIEWPAESPDMNPIEFVWHQLKHFLRHTYKPENKEQLMAGIKTFWRNVMTREQCVKYVKHISHAMPRIIQAGGGNI